MKKVLALTLALMLLCAGVAFASTDSAPAGDATFLTYTNPTNGFSIQYPSDWTMLDKATIGDVINRVTGGSIAGVDGSTLQAYQQKIEAMDMIVCLGPGGVNFNVNYADAGTEITSGLVINSITPAVVQQFKSMFTSVDIQVADQVTTIGGVEYVANIYVINGTTLMSQLVPTGGTTLYTLTFTVPNYQSADMSAIDALMGQVAASFTHGA